MDFTLTARGSYFKHLKQGSNKEESRVVEIPEVSITDNTFSRREADGGGSSGRESGGIHSKQIE